jgi:hypothetical protein
VIVRFKDKGLFVCPRFESVEVCGGVCECADVTLCPEGCRYCRVGEDALLRFRAAMSREYDFLDGELL